MELRGLLLVICSAICATVGFSEWAQHHNYEAMKDVMTRVNKKCPKITKLYELPVNNEFGVPTETWNHRKLLVLEFAKRPGEHVEGVPEFKYIANMHGNEVTGRELLLRLMSYMCDVYNGDMEPEGSFSRKHIQRLIQNTRIHLMPSMNPDGWEIAAGSVDDYQNGVTAWIVGRGQCSQH
ncbi:hypothetical protein DPMN_026647 [Dreissena polymorpha]|uniref:Peptidase M14 domain-containing protein n=1 Tax=Dreissena polymorpha TaxID=45954 RepID=A0A9D4LTT7_DREPO|nr:hypothetical protein DPMN_026647 [Dreissena polymorpha]